MGFWVVMFAVLAAACVVGLLIGLRPSGRRWLSRGWIAEQGATISPAVKREVEDARWHLWTGQLLGALVGIAIVTWSIATSDLSDDAGLVGYQAVLLLPLVMMFVGSGIGGFLEVLPEVRGPIRVAYPEAPRLTDSVNGVGLCLLRIQMALLVIGGLAATQYSLWTGNSFGPVQYALLWGAIIGIVMIWAATEALCRRLVATPQPSSDSATLFWRESLRGESLRQLCRLPAALGYLAPSLITGTLPRSYGTPAAGIGPVVTFGFSVGILGISLLAQLLLIRVPRSTRRATLLRAARLEYENA